MGTEETGFPPEPGPGLLPEQAVPATASRFRKKPVVIEARLFDPGLDYDEACSVVGWCGGRATDEGCEIPTLEGIMLARPGWWVIRGVKGEFYGCDPEVFAQTYEPVTDAAPFAPTPDGSQPSASGAERPLPEGIYGRVELPGMRSDTGWITEGMRGGQCVLVVRDWDGRPLGEYILGPACRLVHLATPLKRPEPRERAAITAGGDPWGHDADEPDDWDERNPF